MRSDDIANDYMYLDSLRQFRNAYPATLMYTVDEKEYRYEERDGEFALKCWHVGRETSWRGEMSSRPPWLVSIVNVAKVGGHLHAVPYPPPDAILWFTTDEHNQLESFLELT
jgi:hypothetical protein